jgi:hypothetical protein
MYKKVPCGPTAFFDVDDTLLMWDLPEDMMLNDDRLVSVQCRDAQDMLLPNHHNILLLKKMSVRGHGIVVWSGGGSDWAEAVVKALELEDFVDVVTSKPTYYIDDIANSKEWIGKHGYFTVDGKRIHGDNFPRTQEIKEK